MTSSRAERTGYAETSSYEDVTGFLRELSQESRLVRVEVFARSHEGRDLPLVVVSDPPVASPAEARPLGRPVAFVMANIHAGEVEGKEACLHLLRRVALGDLSHLAKRLVLLVAPIYNADGNERLGPQAQNRPEQNGPERVGERANAQGLDLNRDYMKLESPEARGLVEKVFSRWDPHLTVDCHATDGSFHGYALTYAPPLNPNGRTAPVAYVRQRLLPAATERMARAGLAAFHYGNFDDPKDPAKGWRTYDHRPRFGNNYLALRNRLCVLSEAYSHDPFRRRVESTEAFLVALLESLAADAAAAVEACAAADREVPTLLAKPSGIGVEFELDEPTVVRLPARDSPLGPDRWVEVPAYTGFRATRTVPRPIGYLIEPSAAPVVRLLQAHGIRVMQLDRGRRPMPVESLRLLEVRRAEEPFQGHRTVSLRVERVRRDVDWGPETSFVFLDQPLSDLAAYLLEPESDDGVVTWNLLDDALARLSPGAPDAFLPVHRLVPVPRDRPAPA